MSLSSRLSSSIHFSPRIVSSILVVPHRLSYRLASARLAYYRTCFSCVVPPPRFPSLIFSSYLDYSPPHITRTILDFCTSDLLSHNMLSTRLPYPRLSMYGLFSSCVFYYPTASLCPLSPCTALLISHRLVTSDSHGISMILCLDYVVRLFVFFPVTSIDSVCMLNAESDHLTPHLCCLFMCLPVEVSGRRLMPIQDSVCSFPAPINAAAFIFDGGETSLERRLDR